MYTLNKLVSKVFRHHQRRRRRLERETTTSGATSRSSSQTSRHQEESRRRVCSHADNNNVQEATTTATTRVFNTNDIEQTKTTINTNNSSAAEEICYSRELTISFQHESSCQAALEISVEPSCTLSAMFGDNSTFAFDYTTTTTAAAGAGMSSHENSLISFSDEPGASSSDDAASARQPRAIFATASSNRGPVGPAVPPPRRELSLDRSLKPGDKFKPQYKSVNLYENLQPELRGILKKSKKRDGGGDDVHLLNLSTPNLYEPASFFETSTTTVTRGFANSPSAINGGDGVFETCLSVGKLDQQIRAKLAYLHCLSAGLASAKMPARLAMLESVYRLKMEKQRLDLHKALLAFDEKTRAERDAKSSLNFNRFLSTISQTTKLLRNGIRRRRSKSADRGGVGGEKATNINDHQVAGESKARNCGGQHKNYYSLERENLERKYESQMRSMQFEIMSALNDVELEIQHCRYQRQLEFEIAQQHQQQQRQNQHHHQRHRRFDRDEDEEEEHVYQQISLASSGPRRRPGAAATNDMLSQSRLSAYSTQQEMQRRIRNKTNAVNATIAGRKQVKFDSGGGGKRQIAPEDLVYIPAFVQDRYVAVPPVQTRLHRSNGFKTAGASSPLGQAADTSLASLSRSSADIQHKYRNPNAHETKV